ncbi:MAG: hypothetical protein OXE05_12460 [Chloroflexi bacterium]|nr:hypothetical protein [Chloroflexota bacterium]
MLHVGTGIWYDYETDEGGDFLDLIAREKRTGRPGAWAWLGKQGLLAPSALFTQKDARKAAELDCTLTQRAPAEHLVWHPGPFNNNLARAYPWVSPPLGVMVGMETVPEDASHPVRRWAALRDLWQPDIPFPPGIAWIPASTRVFREQTGAGTILVFLAPLAAWQATYPHAPRPQALQLMGINAAGTPILGQLEFYGTTAGTCFALLNTTSTTLHVCEGLASGLKLRRYEGESVVVTGDTTGLAQCHTWGYIDCFRPVCLWPTWNEASREAAWRAEQRFANNYTFVSIMYLPDGGDVASVPLWQGDNPFRSRQFGP